MKCHYCRRETIRSILLKRNDPLTRTRDHVIPLSKGGTNARENKVIACLRCNNLKGDMMPDEWQAYMDANPQWFDRTKRERKEAKMAAPAKRDRAPGATMASMVERGEPISWPRGATLMPFYKGNSRSHI